MALSSLIGPDVLMAAKAEKLLRQASKHPALAKYADSPEGYASDVLKVNWWAKQAEIARSVLAHQRTLVKTGHGVGKSFTAGGLVNWWYDTRPSSVVITTAPTYRQVTAVLWREIRNQRRTKPDPDISQIRDPSNPAHYAMGYTSAKNIRADAYESQGAQGIHAEDLLAVLDEAGGVQPSVWQAFDGMAVGERNRVLAIGNPTVNSGSFFEAARSGKWNVITIPVFEHPNILAGVAGEPEPYPGAVSLAWVEEKLKDPAWVEAVEVPEDAPGYFEFDGQWYRARPIAESLLLGQFPTNIIDTIWALAWIEAARNRELMWLPQDSLQIGLDVARFGVDTTAAHARVGPCSVAHGSWAREDNTSTAGRVYQMARELMTELKPARTIIRVDTTGGHGAGPADMLRENFAGIENVQVVDVNSSERPNDPEHFNNARSELWFATADRAREGRLDLTRLDHQSYETLLAQLTAPKFKYDSQGRRVVEAKETTKQWLKRSPDDADAMNLAYYGTQEQVSPKASVEATAGRSRWTGGMDRGSAPTSDWGPSEESRGGRGRWTP